MSENLQTELETQIIFIIKPKTLVLGRPVYHLKERKGDMESKVLAVCPWLEDAERIAHALAEAEGGMVRVIGEEDDEAKIEAGEDGPRMVMPENENEQPAVPEVDEGIEQQPPAGEAGQEEGETVLEEQAEQGEPIPPVDTEPPLEAPPEA